MKVMQLSVYLNEADRMGDIPLHEEVVRRLLRFEISGATVMRGLMGYGKHGTVHRKRLFGVSDDRPIVITAIDEVTRLRAVLPELKSIVPEGLMTLTDVERL